MIDEAIKKGDMVKHFLSEQVGIVLGTKPNGPIGSAYVVWTTQGLSLFSPGSKEWCDQRSLEVLNASR
tara:strand:+ start:296 stop:499 length:204 start_codon:yes stop_codon:yes gene_type:complete